MKRSAPPISLTDRLAALGEDVRLRMLRVLEREELSVGEVAKVVQLPQSTVSRHLKVLSDAGWVLKRTEGTASFYRVVMDDLGRANRALWLAVREQAGETTEIAEDARRLAAVLAARREDSQTFFGRMAGQWDNVRTELFGTKFTPLGMLALLSREWTVIDLGCGTGNAAELLAPVVRRVIAVDRSAPMLSAAKKRLGGFGNVEFVQGEVGSLPLADASADCAVCVLVLHHVDDVKAALNDVRRVLKPGGKLLIVDMIAHDREEYRQKMGHRWLGFSESRLTDWARESGLNKAGFVALASAAEARGPGLFAMTLERPNDRA